MKKECKKTRKKNITIQLAPQHLDAFKISSCTVLGIEFVGFKRSPTRLLRVQISYDSPMTLFRFGQHFQSQLFKYQFEKSTVLCEN